MSLPWLPGHNDSHHQPAPGLLSNHITQVCTIPLALLLPSDRPSVHPPNLRAPSMHQALCLLALSSGEGKWSAPKPFHCKGSAVVGGRKEAVGTRGQDALMCTCYLFHQHL